MKPRVDAAPAAAPVPATAIKAVRQFNRFITRRVGVLDPYLGSNLSLTDVRVLYELAHRDAPVASELARDLGLDGGYLSRVLRRFEAAGWMHRSASARDARQQVLDLTPLGRETFEPLQQRSRDEAAALLAPLPPARQRELVSAMERIENLLAPGTDAPVVPRMVMLREPLPGDMGWVVQQHGEIYAREYGWNSEFEALVADISAKVLRRFDPEWEKAWIAELNGERVGSAFVVRKSKTVAQLRMLILTPAARGLGLGARLTDECLAFARGKGYRKMVLWTNANLSAARDIYARRGFRLVTSEPYRGYGHDLVSETWELRL